jgi:guanylate kinase
MRENYSSILFVLSGPSGIGKNTIAERLLKEVGDKNLKRVVTVTTRQPRNSEVDGVDYHFVTRSKFLEKIQKSEFLEYANVHGEHYYGSLRSDIEEILSAGTNALLMIDTVGVEQILKQRHNLNIVSVFIAPKSLEELEKRIIGRGTETVESIKRRLKTAEDEIKKASMYDYIVTSGARDDDFAAVLDIYKKSTGL